MTKRPKKDAQKRDSGFKEGGQSAPLIVQHFCLQHWFWFFEKHGKVLNVNFFPKLFSQGFSNAASNETFEVVLPAFISRFLKGGV